MYFPCCKGQKLGCKTSLPVGEKTGESRFLSVKVDCPFDSWVTKKSLRQQRKM